MYIILFKKEDGSELVHHRTFKGGSKAILYAHKVAADEQVTILNGMKNYYSYRTVKLEV